MTAHDVARGRAVWALAVAQTLGYACLFYVFAALILFWQADLGWGKSAFATGPLLAILISAALAPVVGRVVDRGRGPEAMTAGSVVGGLALVWLAGVQTPVGWLAGWSAIGVASAASQYEACFAFLIRRLGPDARAAIIRVTLVAGFASTLAFPAGAVLAESLGWRATMLVGAGVMMAGAAPLHWWGARGIRRATPTPVAGARAAPGQIGRTLRNAAFWMLAGVFALISLNHWMVMSFLVPIFVQQGALPATAVMAAATVGPAQVAGRLVLMRWEARIGNAAATTATLFALVVGALILTATGLGPVPVFAYVIVQGAAMGVVTILRPVLIGDVMGQERYGTIAGAIQSPALVAGAVAPMLGALVLEGPGLTALMGLSLCLGVAALGLLVALRRQS